MKTLASVLYLFICLGICRAEEPKVVISERPDWQKPILENVVFGIEVKGVDQLLGKENTQADESWKGFVIFSCTAKENLDKRLLWIDAEVEFSNGYKRKFEGISFHILTKGTEYDIVKIPFNVDEPVSVKSITINSITLK